MKKLRFKILLFSFLLLGCFANNYGQESISETQMQLESLAKKMFVDAINKDFDAILEMTHPKVFDIVPKEQMKTMIKNMFEGNDEFSIELPKLIPEYKLSNIIEEVEKGLEYAFVSYDMKMKMTFYNQEFDDESKEMMIPIMKAQGMDVEFVSNNSMKILMRDKITIFLKEAATNNKWVMMNYEPDSPITYQILSSNLIEKVKEYSRNLMLENKKKSED